MANYYDLEAQLELNYSDSASESTIEGLNFTLILAIGSRF